MFAFSLLMVPATLLKTHKDFILYLDENSAGNILK